MPETSVHVDQCSVASRNDIRLAWQHLAMEAEPEAEPMQGTPERTLRGGVRSPDPTHHPRASRLVDDIHFLTCTPADYLEKRATGALFHES